MDEAKTLLCLQLHAASCLDDTPLARLLVACGSPEALVEGGIQLWREHGLPENLGGELARHLKAGLNGVDSQLATLREIGADAVAITDPAYPPLLRCIPQPPPLLYVRGDVSLLSAGQVAMVGSRKASAAGLRAAGDFAAAITQAGLVLTSGLALGIDAAGHRGALASGGRSIAVMATGIDRIYPARHRDLARELERVGVLVTEFPLGTPPARYNFPRRNRIVSGLALGVLVVEAALPSGSLITARTAVEQGREVFALPWSIYHAGGAGCLYLIRDGAKMVETQDDIFEELGVLCSLQAELSPQLFQAGPAAELSERQRELLHLLGDGAVTPDELSRLCAVPSAILLADLSALELQGLITRGPGGFCRS